MSRPTSKLGRNLKPGDVIRLTDAATYPLVFLHAEVTSVCETRRALSGKRQWRIAYKIVWKSAPRYWGYHDCTAQSDDRYDLVRKVGVETSNPFF